MKKLLIFCCLSLFIVCFFSSCHSNGEQDQINDIGYDFFEKSREDSLSLFDKKEYLERALGSIDKNQNDSLYLKMLHYKAHLLGVEKSYDSAHIVLKDLILGSQKRKDSVALGKAYFIKGFFYGKEQKIDSSYFYYEKSKEVFIYLNDSIQVARRLLNMAIIELEHGDYIQSDASAIEALKYLNHKNNYYAGSVYNCLAISLREQGVLEESLEYYDKAIALAPDDLSKNKYLHNKANLYRSLNDNDKAISIYNILKKDSMILKESPMLMASIIDNLAYSKWLNDTGQDVLAEFNIAFEIRIKEEDYYGLLASYSHFSDYYKSYDKRKSINYANKKYDLSKELNSSSNKLEALTQLIAVDKTNASKKYYEEYLFLQDSLQKASKKAKNQFAKIRYHSDENKKTAILFRAKSIEKQLQLEKEKNIRNIIIAISLILGIGTFFFILMKLQKHKKEKVLEVYKTEKRISEKIHDELSNDVFSLMNNIQFSEFKPETILNELEDIYKRTRNISHENSSVDVGKEFEVSLKQMLSGFIHSNCKVLIKDLNLVDINSLEAVKQIVVYRILQELMVNMKKHSRARLVVLTFKNKDTFMEVNYADNGVGCELNNIKNKNGLQNMETRIASIRGTLNFDVKPTKGFKVAIHFKR